MCGCDKFTWRINMTHYLYDDVKLLYPHCRNESSYFIKSNKYSVVCLAHLSKPNAFHVHKG